MRKLLGMMILLSGPLYAAGEINPIGVSTVTAGIRIDAYSNANGDTRQAIVVGDRTSSATVTVDSIQGMQVYLGTSSASGIGTLTGITNSVTVGQTTAASLKASVLLDGTSNSVQITGSLPTGTNNIGVMGYAQGATTSGEVGPLIQGAVTTSTPSYTTGQTSPISLDTSGNLRVQSPLITFAATQPTLTNGSAYDINITTRGALIVSSGIEGFATMVVSTAAPSVSLTSISAGTNSRAVVDSYGRLAVVGPRYSFASSSGTAITTATNTQLIAAPGTSLHLRIYYVHASNSGSTTTKVSWREGTTGALRYETSLAQNSAFAHNLKPGYWDVASNTALNMNTTATGNVYWTVEYEVLAD